MTALGGVYLDADSQIETAKLTTTDATVSTLWSKEIPTGFVGRIRVAIVARKSDGTDRASYERVCTVYRASSTAALGGSVLVPTTDYESSSGWDATIDLSTNTLRVRVTGAASTTIYWNGRIEFIAG